MGDLVYSICQEAIGSKYCEVITDAGIDGYSVIYYLLAINLLTFAALGIDKYFARNKMWRISEFKLLSLTAIGGSAGALLARSQFRHKTRKQPFASILLAIACLHAFLAAYVAYMLLVIQI